VDKYPMEHLAKVKNIHMKFSKMKRKYFIEKIKSL